MITTRANLAGMRQSGLVEHVRGFGSHDHVCWRYENRAEFRSRAAEFLVEGLQLGHQVRYIGTGDVHALREELAGIEALEAALRDGTAQVASLDDTYPVDGTIQPAEQVRAYAAATQEAVTAGFAGLRVVADCTALVRGQEQRAAFARYEHLVDRYMSAHPFSAMCAYDVNQLPAEAITQVACLHPSTNANDTGFRLHATGRAGGATALGGELDLARHSLFTWALDRADLQPADGKLVIDAIELTFVDHNCLLQLATHARHHDAALVLRTRRPGADRLVRTLNLPDVQVERAT